MPEIEVIVFEMIKDDTFENIFGSLSCSLEQLCFQQDQIIGFVVRHKDKLCQDGWGTLFLFKRDQNLPATPENLFVAGVYVDDSGSSGVVGGRFSSDRVWDTEGHPCLVIPQLT